MYRINKRFFFISVILITILLSLFFLIINKQFIQEEIIDCFKEKNCIRFKIEKIKLQLPFFICKNKYEGLEQDLCLRDIIYQKYDSDVFLYHNHEICKLMNNPYLEYVCRRTEYRPHMRQFMINKFSVDPDHKVNYEEYYNIIKMYVSAAEYASINLTYSISICNQIIDPEKKGECNFFILTSILMRSQNQDYNKLFGFCGLVEYPFWRAECYYLIADELAISNSDVTKIFDSCVISEKLADFHCLDHAIMILSEEKAISLCKLVKDKILAKRCYFGIGKKVLESNNFDLKNSIRQCSIFPEDYVNSCINGVYLYLGATGPDVNDVFIDKIPKKYQEYYIKGKSCSIDLISRNPSSFIKECNKFPELFRDRCYWYIGKLVGRTSNTDTLTITKKCTSIPFRYRDLCFKGSIESMCNNVINDVSYTNNKCNDFPEDYIEGCHETIGGSIARHFRYNLTLANKRCDEVPEYDKASCIKGLNDYIDQDLMIS